LQKKKGKGAVEEPRGKNIDRPLGMHPRPEGEVGGTRRKTTHLFLTVATRERRQKREGGRPARNDRGKMGQREPIGVGEGAERDDKRNPCQPRASHE